MTPLERRCLEFLEALNKVYVCTDCHQQPEHESDCKFYRLLCELRAKAGR